MISYRNIPQKLMNEESLKAHLAELEAKGMNTRGVLRKLLQQYCKDGNLAAAREIAKKCQAEGVSGCSVYGIRKNVYFAFYRPLAVN